MKWQDRIKAEFDNNPTQTILVAAFVATAASKVIDSVSAAGSRRAYAKQIDHKVRSRR